MKHPNSSLPLVFIGSRAFNLKDCGFTRVVNLRMVCEAPKDISTNLSKYIPRSLCQIMDAPLSSTEQPNSRASPQNYNSQNQHISEQEPNKFPMPLLCPHSPHIPADPHSTAHPIPRRQPNPNNLPPYRQPQLHPHPAQPSPTQDIETSKVQYERNTSVKSVQINSHGEEGQLKLKVEVEVESRHRPRNEKSYPK